MGKTFTFTWQSVASGWRRRKRRRRKRKRRLAYHKVVDEVLCLLDRNKEAFAIRRIFALLCGQRDGQVEAGNCGRLQWQRDGPKP